MRKIKMGDRVKDKVTGFTGIIVAKIEYLNGCEQYCVKPLIDKDGKMSEGEYIDVDQVEPAGEEGIKYITPPRKIRTGGPQPDCPKH